MKIRQLTPLLLLSVTIILLSSCAASDFTQISSDRGAVTVSSIYAEQEDTVPATFADGEGGLSINYPDECYEEGVQGVVLIQMNIRNDGELINAQVEDGIGGGCDEAALEMIEDQNFNPATDLQGEPITARHLVQVSFIREE